MVGVSYSHSFARITRFGAALPKAILRSRQPVVLAMLQEFKTYRATPVRLLACGR
jgi:hypothetical protein